MRHALNPVFSVDISARGTYVHIITFLVAIEQISQLNNGGLIRDGLIPVLVLVKVLIPVTKIGSIGMSNLI